MRGLLFACIGSIGLYLGLFGWILDRPLGLGMFRGRIDSAIARGVADSPKLVVIAGSNAPFSHRCETMEPLIDRPCINAGVAVGIGLDYLFARWRAVLRSGDWVYLPLEDAQNTRTRAANTLGPDAAILFRHDRATLAAFPLDRQLSAAFAFDLRSAVMSILEMTLVAARFVDPRAEATPSNAWGDRIGHTADRASGYRARLDQMESRAVRPEAIAAGYGADVVADFLAWARAQGVVVIGGLPTGFDDSPGHAEATAAIQTFFETHATRFLALPNRSRYPRSAFFDSPDHLHEDAQIAHSRVVARGLVALMAATPAATR